MQPAIEIRRFENPDDQLDMKEAGGISIIKMSDGTVGMRATFEPVQLSFSLAPRVTWQAIEGLKVFAAAEFFEGNPWSPFGYFGRNDRILIGARYEIF